MREARDHSSTRHILRTTSKKDRGAGGARRVRWAAALLGAALLAAPGRSASAQPVVAHARRVDAPTPPGAGAPKPKDVGSHDAARSVTQDALTLWAAALGPRDEGVNLSLCHLASLYFEQVDYDRAEPLLQRALGVLEKALGPDDPNVGIALGFLAGLYFQRGDFARAEPIFQRSLAIMEKAFGADHPDMALALANLAGLYEEKGDAARAEALFQRALDIREKALGPDHPDVALLLTNLAGLYEEKGDAARAEALFQRALDIREKALGPDHPDVARSLDDLAGQHLLNGALGRAEPLLQRALGIQEAALGRDHPDVGRSLDYLATLEASREDYPHAIALARRAAELREKNLTLTLTTGSESQKRASLGALAEGVDSDVWLAVHTGAPDAADLAVSTLLRRKGRALDAMADSMGALRARLGVEEQSLFDRLLAIRSERSAATLRGPGQNQLASYRKHIVDLEGQDQALETTISERSAVFRAHEQPIRVAAVKSALPEGSALVEWSVYRPSHPNAMTPKARWGPPRYAACVLPRQGEPTCVDLGEAERVDAGVTRLRRALRRAASQDVRALGREIDAQVMAKVRALLGETRSVFLVPDGALNLIPMAALVDEDGRYLLETYSFTYLTSGRDLLRLREAAPPPREAAMVMASPDFDASGRAAPAGEDGRDDGKRDMVSSDFSGLTFSALSGTEGEARTVARTLASSRVLVGGRATEQAFKALHGPSALHVATHGFFLPDQPGRGGEDPLLRSGLALAGANLRRSGADDGVLTALEVSGTDLYGTRLVVLSACETAMGDVINGDGVYGLRRALVLAGARTQVMSLWRVDDSATREMMTAYYGRLQQGEGRSLAMRKVQLAMLSQGERTNPHYWASFIVSGDWSALDGKPMVPDLGRVHPGARGCACAEGRSPAPGNALWAAVIALGIGLQRRAARRGPRRATARRQTACPPPSAAGSAP